VSGKAGKLDDAVSFFYEKIKAQGTEFAPGSERQKALQQSASNYLKRKPDEAYEAQHRRQQ